VRGYVGDTGGLIAATAAMARRKSRAKFVNKGFVQAIEEHWRSRTMQWNQGRQP
jgi:hypothetical protein